MYQLTITSMITAYRTRTAVLIFPTRAAAEEYRALCCRYSASILEPVQSE